MEKDFLNQLISQNDDFDDGDAAADEEEKDGEEKDDEEKDTDETEEDDTDSIEIEEE